jgi:hypothetical protein
MHFDPQVYGDSVAKILALDGGGSRPMPLVRGRRSAPAAELIRQGGSTLFAQSRAPGAALAGLYFYFSGWIEAHRLAQDIQSPEGNYWHAMVHRQEPDAGNAGYWFRMIGRHAIFPALYEQARQIQEAYPIVNLRLAQTWDPFAFIEVCERAQPGSQTEKAAQEIQLAEWQLLFDYCAAKPE